MSLFQIYAIFITSYTIRLTTGFFPWGFENFHPEVVAFAVSKDLCVNLDARNRFLVKRANRKHMKQCATLCVQTFFGNDTDVFENEKRCYEELIERSADKYTKQFVVEYGCKESSTVVGFVEVGLTKDNCNILGSNNMFKLLRPKITALAVDKNYRRRGLGALLVMACEHQAKLWHHDDIFLEVNIDNIAAKLLYEKLGFRENKYATALLDKKSGILLYIKSLAGAESALSLGRNVSNISTINNVS